MRARKVGNPRGRKTQRQRGQSRREPERQMDMQKGPGEKARHMTHVVWETQFIFWVLDL